MEKGIVQYRCSKAAVLSDVHSNYYGLKACLEDAEKEGADCFIFLGDYVSGLAGPVKTLDLVYEICERYPSVCIRGNRERYMLEQRTDVSGLCPGSNTGSFLFTYRQLRERDLSFFASLPISRILEINGVAIEIAHATMENDRVYFEAGDDKIREVFANMEAPYLLTGHSHKQYACTENQKTIINPGSVGLPQGNGWHAQYALLTVSDGAVHSALRQVPYDMEALIRAQFQSGLVELGCCWAIADLYGAMTGKECTKALLTQLYSLAEENKSVLSDEAEWERIAAQMGMRFTEEGVLSHWRNRNG